MTQGHHTLSAEIHGASAIIGIFSFHTYHLLSKTADEAFQCIKNASQQLTVQ